MQKLKKGIRGSQRTSKYNMVMQQVCSREDLLTQLIWPHFVDAVAERWTYF